MLWKQALITPIPKYNSVTDLSHLRPISGLSECSKVFERILSAQVIQHLADNKLLDERQAGFREGHSTQTALLGVLDDVRVGMDNSMYTILVLFDFSRAFDTIPHNILIHKLRSLKFSDITIQWFTSYLAGRSQAVVDEVGNLSDWADISAGVPQGSVLGPLLFAIFINDLPSVLRYTRHMIYADDTQIYRSCRRHELIETIRLVSSDADAISRWATANGLTLNLEKTKVIILGSTPNLAYLDVHSLPNVTVNSTPIRYVTEVKNLGVWLTPDLNWSKHVSHICQRVFGTLRQLRPHQHALSFQIRKLLTQSLILPSFDYACLVYHDLTAEQNTKLQRAQNACTRFVYGNIPWRDHVTPHRIRLGWLTVKARREYFMASLCFQILRSARPKYLADRFILSADCDFRRSDRTRTEPLLIRKHKTSLLANSFHITASRFWNNLPDAISTCPFPPSSSTIHTFKTIIYNHLRNTEAS